MRFEGSLGWPACGLRWEPGHPSAQAVRRPPDDRSDGHATVPWAQGRGQVAHGVLQENFLGHNPRICRKLRNLIEQQPQSWRDQTPLGSAGRTGMTQKVVTYRQERLFDLHLAVGGAVYNKMNSATSNLQAFRYTPLLQTSEITQASRQVHAGDGYNCRATLQRWVHSTCSTDTMSFPASSSSSPPAFGTTGALNPCGCYQGSHRVQRQHWSLDLKGAA